jgi:DNA ligase-1
MFIRTTVINKIIPGCVPAFEVALAHAYDESTKKRVNWKDCWYVSRKLDGNRCIVIVDVNGNIEIKSRNGKDIETLQKVADEIKKLNVKSVVFDGEICLVKENGDEDFAGIMKENRKKDHTITNPKYKMFDQISLVEFENLKGDTKLSERQLNLMNTLMNYKGDVLDLVVQTLITSTEDLEKWSEHAATNGWEGVMIRKDAGYEAGRTYDLLKVKKFKDGEYIVEDIDMGPFRVVVDNMEVEEQVMRNVFISHKGYRVSVGSGFSLEQRRKYYKNPELLIGNLIKVQYFEETENQQGGLSLRFPTVKFIYDSNIRED